MGPTTTFNELYDCARKLGTCEVVLKHIPYAHRRPGLAVVVRCTEDARPVHRAVVRTTVEEAACRVRTKIERHKVSGS